MASEGDCMKERSALDWALDYANLGWRVFPVVPGEKRPRYKGWQRDATSDPELVGRYWRSEPGPNIGALCGEAFDAVDVEAPHLQRLRDWLADKGQRLPATPIARTGRGGVHILIKAGGGTGRALRLEGLHIGELKATGGFIVVCPSRTESTYAWINSPGRFALASAPVWLDELTTTKKASQPMGKAAPLDPSRAVALTAGLYRVVAGASEGERNQLLFWASCRVAEHGLDTVAASEILMTAAIQAGLPEAEARRTIASGLDR
jgi:hypothetical protein